MLTGVNLRLLLWSWYFNKLFTDQVFKFYALLQMHESRVSLSPIKKKPCTFSTSFYKSVNFNLYSSVFPMSLFCSAAASHVLVLPSSLASTFVLTNSVVFFTRHHAFNLGNWILGFSCTSLIAPLYLCFEGLVFFMTIHSNVHSFCFNRMKSKKAFWFLEYLQNLSYW